MKRGWPDFIEPDQCAFTNRQKHLAESRYEAMATVQRAMNCQEGLQRGLGNLARLEGNHRAISTKNLMMRESFAGHFPNDHQSLSGPGRRQQVYDRTDSQA